MLYWKEALHMSEKGNCLNRNKLCQRRHTNNFIVLCSLTYFISYLTRINYGAVIVEIVRTEGITKSAASLATTGSFITYGLGQIISGYLGDRMRPKYLIICPR